MELGHHLQLIMTATLILTAAVVAFLCDVLKRNNDQLREMNLELKLRSEQLLAPRIPKRVDRPREIAPPTLSLAAPKERSALNPSAGHKGKKRTVNSEALAAMERGAALAGSGVRHRAEPAAVVTAPEPEPKRKDWGTLLARNSQAPKPVAPPTPVQTIDGLPAGFQDGFVLNKLVQSHQPITGLVVSIGVNTNSKPGRALPEAVAKLVESLLGPNDFAAQSGEDEFLLIYPQERGASAQRRLSKIAQQLWDFQLRSLGSLQILFSWGGVEVRSESIDEAIASASERMQETKRGRKLLTMSLPDPVPSRLRQAM